MVKIRLSRLGKTNRPYWRIVAVDSRKKRDGVFLDNLGSYDPIKHEVVQLHIEKINEWVSKGAVLSDAVKKIIKMQKKDSSAVSEKVVSEKTKTTEKVEDAQPTNA